MSGWTVVLRERDYAASTRATQWQLTPVRYTWSALGGPLDADMELEGSDERAVWEALETLRCAVTISDPQSTAVWWGYVESVEVEAGGIRMGASLEGMANRVAVLYESDAGEKGLTDWLANADSVGLYGTKELILSGEVKGQTAAEALRAAYLGRFRLPAAQFQTGESTGGGMRASLHCRGWFQTLGWKYYGAATGTASDTTAQIAAMVTAAGQFLTGCVVRTTSGITCDPYRSGEKTALAEIEALLAAGKSDGTSLVATVNRQRELVIESEPSGVPEVYLRRDGRARDTWGNAIGSRCPAGVWGQLQDVVPGSVDNAVVTVPTRFFVQEASYEVAAGVYKPTPRGQNSDFGAGTRIEEG